MAAKKRTTKKASNSIVEPQPTTSSNGRRIAILVIVVLGIVILWRGGDDTTVENSDVANTENTDTPTYDNGWSGDSKDVDSYVPQTERENSGDYMDKRNLDYNPDR